MYPLTNPGIFTFCWLSKTLRSASRFSGLTRVRATVPYIVLPPSAFGGRSLRPMSSAALRGRLWLGRRVPHTPRIRTAVDHDRRARDVAASRRRQERNRGRDLLGPTRPPHRDLLREG